VRFSEITEQPEQTQQALHCR